MANLIVAVIVTLVLRAMKTPAGADATRYDDYFVEEGDPGVEDLSFEPGEEEPVRI